MSTNPRKRVADVRNGGELRFGEFSERDITLMEITLAIVIVVIWIIGMVVAWK